MIHVIKWKWYCFPFHTAATYIHYPSNVQFAVCGYSPIPQTQTTYNEFNKCIHQHTIYITLLSMLLLLDHQWARGVMIQLELAHLSMYYNTTTNCCEASNRSKNKPRYVTPVNRLDLFHNLLKTFWQTFDLRRHKQLFLKIHRNVLVQRCKGLQRKY